MLLRKFLQEIW